MSVPVFHIITSCHRPSFILFMILLSNGWWQVAHDMHSNNSSLHVTSFSVWLAWLCVCIFPSVQDREMLMLKAFGSLPGLHVCYNCMMLLWCHEEDVSVCDCCRVWSWSTTECDGAGGWRCAATVGQVTVWLHISTHAGFGLFSVDLLSSTV